VTSDLSGHELRYRAAATHVVVCGVPGAFPHWYCSCGAWQDISGRPDPSGAAKRHRKHAREAR